jgi:membrane protein
LESASKSSSGATIVGFITLLIGASTVFGQLKDSLNTIWEVQPKATLGWRGFVKDRLLSFGMVLVIGFLLLVSLVATTIAAMMTDWLERHVGLPAMTTGIFGYVVPLLVETLLFALIFKVLPDAEVDWHSVWVGAGFTALLFEVGKVGLSLYLARTSATSSFGAAGSLVLVLLWVYYASCILFFGAEVTEVYARLRGRSIQPNANAESAEIKCRERNTAPAALTAPVRTPPRESLAPLLAACALDRAFETTAPARVEAPSRKRPRHRCIDHLDLHPCIEIGAAVGLGFVIGTWSQQGKT